jgi:Dolichyl-phosphate-mannose-protein mannosyltransferase
VPRCQAAAQRVAHPVVVVPGRSAIAINAVAVGRQPAIQKLAVLTALVAIVAAGGALRDEGTTDRHSPPVADERAYLRIAGDLRRAGQYGDAGMKHPLHWAPGTPALFAVAEAVSPPAARGGPLPQADRRAQAVVSTGAIAAAFALAGFLGGPIAGLVAAAAVAVYPPMVETSGVLVSEPLGALTLLLAALALAWAWRGPPTRFLLAGVALGVACLTRADLLLPALLVVPAAGALLWRPHGRRHALTSAGCVLAALLAAIAPWIAYASLREGAFVPITDGGTSTLYVATSLEGHGTVFGLKRALAPEVRRRDPRLRGQPAFRIPSTAVFDAIAARHPHMSRDAAIRAELHRNLADVARHPLAYLGLEASKVWRMWGSYYHAIPHRHRREALVWLHRAFVLLALAGALIGLHRARRRELALLLGLVLAATAVNLIFVAEARHAARLVPTLVAVGAAGWALALRRRDAAPTARDDAGTRAPAAAARA